jgi:transposase-like protein
MNGNNLSNYFLTPKQPTHRRYEALRAVFVEDEPMQDVAQRFDVSYGTIRNWASEFSRTYQAGETPPFLFQQIEGLDLRKLTMT